jgi:RNAse (barnase) inhibitor barstar
MANAVSFDKSLWDFLYTKVEDEYLEMAFKKIMKDYNEKRLRRRDITYDSSMRILDIKGFKVTRNGDTKGCAKWRV